MAGEAAESAGLDSDTTAPDACPSSEDASNPDLERILRRLDERTRPGARHWTHGLLVLGSTLFLFAVAGLFRFQTVDLGLIVLVLLIHEGGHYLGMRLFDYRDVRMFFIPFFGAAVAGRHTNIAGWKQAVVILLGPVPGLFIGLGLAAIGPFTEQDLLRRAAWMFLALNAFNLLPFLPLDGGRLLHLVLFSRQRHVEALFQLAAGAALVWLGWIVESWILAILGGVIVLVTGHAWRVSSIARAMRADWSDDFPAPEPGGGIPRERAVPLIARVRAAIPQLADAGAIAATAQAVWERLHTRPPGPAASAALVAVYLAALAGSPWAFLALIDRPASRVVVVENHDGTITRRHETRVGGRLVTVIELSENGEYHGRHVEFFPHLHMVALEGGWRHGKRHGEWTRYTEAGEVLFVETYEAGAPVSSRRGGPE